MFTKRALSSVIALFLLAVAHAASASIVYVQGNSAHSGSGSSVSVTFSSSQTAGDFNVLIIGWSGASAPSSITDSKGNTYALAVGPTNSQQSIYYAKNIAAAAAGTNTVTVTFASSVSFLDMRAAEYSGIDTTNPLDGAVGAGGSSVSISSGSLTTTNANDLLIASDYTSQTTTGPGSGYTQRFITYYDDIFEDEIVSTAGTYAGTATQDATGSWVMQLAAFKAAASGGDTSPPTTPTGLTATATSSSQINLSWTASTDNVGVTGYRVERCAGSSCTTFAQIASSTATSYSDSGLTASTSYTYRVRATDAAGNLSGYSSTETTTTSGGSNSISYVQGYSSSQGSASAGAVTFTAAQTAGNLNVLIVGWSGTSGPSSITDSKGNTYALAVGPTSSQQSIYYAKNIAAAAAGTNTVTVNFASSVSFLDIRAAEYSGIDTSSPLDGAVGASGSAISINSGSLTTTNAHDLLVASDYTSQTTTGPGSGYTQRFITYYDDILEDEIVSTAGTYTGTATQNATGSWVMQMAAFKAAASGGDTSPPTRPTALTATAVSSSQINLSWTASTDNVGVSGYRVERCTGSSCTTFAQIDSPTATSYSDSGLTASTSYTYRVRATDAAGNLSVYSSTVTASTPATGGGGSGDTTPPTTPGTLSASGVSGVAIQLTWSASSDNVGVTGYLIERCLGAACTSFTQVASVTTTTLTDVGLTPASTYVYRARATDAVGNESAYSNVVSAETLSSGAICD